MHSQPVQETDDDQAGITPPMTTIAPVDIVVIGPRYKNLFKVRSTCPAPERGRFLTNKG